MPRTQTTESKSPKPPPPKGTKRGVNPTRPKQIEQVRANAKNQWHEAHLIDVNKPLTDKQKALIKAFAQGESLTTATARAGYQNSPFYGHTLIKQPNARALYDAEKLKYEESCQMTRKRVMEGLLEGVEMAKLAGEPASVISGWREIGKMCGYYEPVTRKVELTVNGSVVLDRMNRLSDAELLKLIQEDVTAVISHEVHDEV